MCILGTRRHEFQTNEVAGLRGVALRSNGALVLQWADIPGLLRFKADDVGLSNATSYMRACMSLTPKTELHYISSAEELQLLHLLLHELHSNSA
eukprot:304855-Chlamydomonas_euryale.AAC.1